MKFADMEHRPGIVMRNELVLVKISRHLPVTDLLSLRRTCTMWNRTLLSELRAIHDPIQLINSPESTGSRMRLREYTQLMSTSMEVPFSAYHLHDGKGCQSQTVDEFLDVCGNSVRSLYLVDYSSPISTFISNLWRTLARDKLQALTELDISHLDITTMPSSSTEPPEHKGTLPKLPNLKRLVLSWAMEPVHGEFMGELIHAATGLESLKLDGAAFYHWGEREFNLVALTALRDHAHRLDKLRELKTTGLKLPEVKILIQLANRTRNRLQLQSFTVLLFRSGWEEGSSQEICDLFQQFLETQAPTLRRLKIEFKGNIEHHTELLPLLLPKLGRLHEFSVKGCGQTWARNLSFGEVNLRDNFPELRKLRLTHDDKAEADVGILEGSEDLMAVAHPGVSEVKVNLVDLSHHTEQLRLWLPSVTQCHLVILGCMIRRDWSPIWTAWPALESLSIFCEGKMRRRDFEEPENLDLDAILSGIPAVSHEALRVDLNSAPRPVTSAIFRQLLEKYKTRPGISDLSQLKRFVLRADVYLEDDSCTWTDIGGSFGLAMAGNAGGLPQHVEVRLIRASGLQRQRMHGQISTKCTDMLRQLLGPTAVIDV